VLVTGYDADAVAAVQINEAAVAACVYSLACVMNAGDVRPTR
jgi:hypothetical protein